MLWPQTGTLLLTQNCGLCISRDAVATAHDRRWSTTFYHRLLTLIIFDCLSDNQWFLLIHLMPCRVQVCVVETRRQTSMPGSRPVKKPSPTLRRLHTVPLHDRSVIQATSLSPVFSVSWFGPSLSFIHITHIFSFTTYHCKVIDCQKQSVFWPTLYVCISMHRRRLLEMTVGARFQGVHPPLKSHDANSYPPFLPLPFLLPISSPSPFSLPLPSLPLEVGPLKSS